MFEYDITENPPRRAKGIPDRPNASRRLNNDGIMMKRTPQAREKCTCTKRLPTKRKAKRRTALQTGCSAQVSIKVFDGTVEDVDVGIFAILENVLAGGHSAMGFPESKPPRHAACVAPYFR